MHAHSNLNRFVLAATLLLGFLLTVEKLQAQTGRQVEIVQAGSLEGDRIAGREVRRLVGGVVFRQEETYLYCDSALFFEDENVIDAYGSVKITGPRARVFGDFLHYDGNSRLADITGRRVRLEDGRMELFTTAMQYDMARDIGSYTQGGRMVDGEGVLTSRKAYYFAAEQAVYFRQDVVLEHPRFRLLADTLRYHAPSATCRFLGPTRITGIPDGQLIQCTTGWYDTKAEKAWFGVGSSLKQDGRLLLGDSILYDRNKAIGQAWHNVSISDSAESIRISGDRARTDDRSGISWVTGNSLMAKDVDGDSLFMHADTLWAFSDSSAQSKRYRAYRDVRLFKSDLQGKCDSLEYAAADSSIRFFGRPVLWSDNNQLSADTMVLELRGDTLHSLTLVSSAFIATKEDERRFSQVRGKAMDARFVSNRVNLVYVSGNGETVYFLRNRKKQLSGVNAAVCSDMRIRFEGNKVSRVTLLTKPEATLTPVKDADPEQLRLPGFNWRGSERPLGLGSLFLP